MGGGCDDVTECMLYLEAFNGTQLISSNYLLLAPFFDVTTMQDPKLKAIVTVATQIDEIEGLHIFEVQVLAESVAAFVWLETSYEGFWSDNGVMILDGVAELQFFSRSSELSSDMLHNSLMLTSLFDTSPEYGQNS